MVRVRRVPAFALALGLVACGASRSTPHGGHGDARGGASGNAASGGSGAGSAGTTAGTTSDDAGAGAVSDGGRSGAGMDTTGGRSAGGASATAGGPGAGAPGAGGSVSGSGGLDASVAGASSEAGTGAEGGSAGAASGECGEYVACGCGCCTTDPPPTTTCFYPERGETLASVVAADQAAAAAPTCAHSCTSGVLRVCCESDSAATTAGTYELGVYSADFDRISVDFTSPDDRCTHFEILRGVPGLDGYAYDLPTGWAPAIAIDSACADRWSQLPGKQRGSIGGTGWVLFSQADGCTFSLDVTIYFPSPSGGVDGVRLKADNMPLSEFDGAACH